MPQKNRIRAFAQLGDIFKKYLEEDSSLPPAFRQVLQEATEKSEVHNPWFTNENIRLALGSLAKVLQAESLEKWLAPYDLQSLKPKRVAVISAGNIPLVGFHDMLCVLITGHHLIMKLSGKDEHLPKAIAKILCEINHGFKSKITFTEDKLTDFDAVIATGSNNTGRYFEYYFGKYPHIIRKNRNSVAVLTGKESTKELELLAGDIFEYFGLGCRNVSKLYLPLGYEIPNMLGAFEKYNQVINHHKYANNYDYNRAVYLVNRIPHYDTGFVLLKEDPSLSSPLGVVHYSWYSDISRLANELETLADQIQCIVGENIRLNTVPFGKSQSPELWDYADGVDTIDFLQHLK